MKQAATTKRLRNRKAIKLCGVRVNNLKNIDLEIPHGQRLAVCGPSGSGKSSLVFGTIFAEGQRRYVETFSPYARQFLDQIERPAAESLHGIPPAIGYVARPVRFGRRATVASAIELLHHLQLLFTRAGAIVCPTCQRPVVRYTAESIVAWIENIPAGCKIMVGFPTDHDERHTVKELRRAGFSRVLLGDRILTLDEIDGSLDPSTLVIVDRLVAGKAPRDRIIDSVTTALEQGSGACTVLRELATNSEPPPNTSSRSIDGSSWSEASFFRDLICSGCRRRFFPPDPQRLSDSSPLGACPTCEGLGSVSAYDPQKIVPDESLSIRQGAIAPWNSPSYEHEREELMALAGDFGIDIDLPYRKLSKTVRQLIWDGVPERSFGGVAGFFRWVEKKRYKMHMRIFAARWKSFHPCQTCHGQRWNEAALVYRVAGRNIAQLYAMSLQELDGFLRDLAAEAALETPGRMIVLRLLELTGGLLDLGLGDLPLGRPMQTLSGGEQQLLMIGRLIRSSLVNLVYAFDEPTSGLHPDDAANVVKALEQLSARKNTVIVADHSTHLIRSCERVVELGPGAGEQGGTIVFDGPPSRLAKHPQSPTGRYLKSFRRDDRTPRPISPHKVVGVRGCTGRNLKGIDLDVPLGVLVQVVGVKASGKTSLIRDTLYQALAAHFGQADETPLPHEKLIGADRIEGIVLVDDAPAARSSRSNPATVMKTYDLIRKLFAETEEAKRQGLTASHFSFNVAGGRCEKCLGEGFLDVDMHFLADMRLVCDECRGTRFRPNVLKAQYRGKNITEVLEMTAQQAFPFFRGQKKLQLTLKSLMDAGLGYLRLGQSLRTLSHGEERRLKLAQHLGSIARGRKLFVVMHPTKGLHPAELSRLVDCFDSLLSVGHSLIVVDNEPLLAHDADWLIELGPGSGSAGGEVLFQGPPQEMATSAASRFGRWLHRHE